LDPGIERTKGPQSAEPARRGPGPLDRRELIRDPPLVPGSAGFNSLLQLLAGQTVSGIEAGFNTFVTAMAIAIA